MPADPPFGADIGWVLVKTSAVQIRVFCVPVESGDQVRPLSPVSSVSSRSRRLREAHVGDQFDWHVAGAVGQLMGACFPPAAVPGA